MLQAPVGLAASKIEVAYLICECALILLSLIAGQECVLVQKTGQRCADHGADLSYAAKLAAQQYSRKIGNI